MHDQNEEGKRRYFTYWGMTGKNVKPWPNDRNISAQHIPTLLGATCCTSLVSLLRRARASASASGHARAKHCCMAKRLQHPQMLLEKFKPKTLNTSQHVATGWSNAYNMCPANNVAIGCVEMLRRFARELKFFKKDEYRTYTEDYAHRAVLSVWFPPATVSKTQHCQVLYEHAKQSPLLPVFCFCF